MAISNELSSEIAAAILVEKNPTELTKLKDVILRVHSTLQQMSEEERAARSKDLARRGSSQKKAGSA